MSHKNTKKRNTRVFALLIGINEYQDRDIYPLDACENDVDSMESFLKDTFKDPTIKRLVNGKATCKGILETLKEFFTDNTDIGRGDVMIFYFAGHGSRVKAPHGWKMVDGKVETICPYDQNKVPEGGTARICGIPDHKLNLLFREVSSKRKNNNIIAVFDSCHSGGMGRDEIPSYPGKVRSIDTPDPSQEDFKQDAWLINNGRDSNLSYLSFIYPFMSSHILLAACSSQGKAFEGPFHVNIKTGERVQVSTARGVFTRHLVPRLYNAMFIEQSTTTYVTLLYGLLKDLRLSVWDTNQQPVCEGLYTKRHLFSTTSEEPMFELTNESSLGRSSFQADAGWMHGVVKGTEFIVYPNHGTLVANKVRSNSCDLVFTPGHEFYVPSNGRALMSLRKSLKVYLGKHVNDPDVTGQFTIVTTRAEAHVAAHFISAGISRLEAVDDGRLLQHSRLSGQVLSQDLVAVLDKIAFFNFHLHRASAYPRQDERGVPKDYRSSGCLSWVFESTNAVFKCMQRDKGGRPLLDECNRPLFDERGCPLLDERVYPQYDENERPLHGKIKLKLVPLDDERGFSVPINGQARFLDEDRPTSVNIPASQKYGLTLENHSDHKLFPYLFYFRPLDCTITPYYIPAVSEEPPVAGRIEHFPMVGYGGQGDPIRFFLSSGQTVDSIYFKLFVSTSYVDMNLADMKIKAEDGYLRAAIRVPSPSSYTWDTWSYEIMCCTETSMPAVQAS